MALWKKDPKVPAVEALFDASKVDLVAISPDGKFVEVIIVNDSPWTGSDAQVVSLQQKIQTYVGFALDGQMVATYPETKGLAWRIVIADRAGPPDARSADVIALIGETGVTTVKVLGGTLGGYRPIWHQPSDAP